MKINRSGVAEMLAMPGMVAEMGRRALLVEARAKATAPVDEDGPHPGRYKDSISAKAFVRPKGEDPPRARRKNARACGRVTAESPEALFVEFGTEKTPAHRTLRDALEAAGD